jgi:hypothetical protein
MKKSNQIIALLVASSLLFASNASAKSVTRAANDDRPSTTEKVLGALAIGAIVGVAAYALADDDDHHYRGGRYYRSQRDYRRYDRHHRRYERHHRRYDRRHYSPGHHRRAYIAFSNGFTSFAIGYERPGYRMHHARPYWYRHGGIHFYRVPYRYKRAYSRAWNAGWERGYWAGYLQGKHDAMNRQGRYSRYDGYQNGQQLWGYSSEYGNYDQYAQAFDRSYTSGYEQAYSGRDYGEDDFGYEYQNRY